MPESEFRRLLSREFAPYAQLTTSQLDQLEDHYNLLMRWNERMNLTRIRKLEDAVRLHYCESLFLGTLLPGGPLTIADLGSGAGFPGIPLAILRPTSQVTLIESHHRKAVFLREASRKLPNVRVLPSRLEQVTERFDWMVSRGVALSRFDLAGNCALLLSRDQIPSQADDWKLIPVPWGRQRVVALFHVEH